MRSEITYTCDKCGRDEIIEQDIYHMSMYGGTMGKGMSESYDLCLYCSDEIVVLIDN